MLVTGGAAMLTATGGHITAGSFGGTIALGGGVTGVSITGGITVTFSTDAMGNRSVVITGTNDNVTVFGQTISGNFTISDNGNGTVNVQISGLSLSLGGGFVMVSGGMANFTIATGAGGDQITGTASGTLSVGGGESSFVTFTGNVTVTLTAASLTVSGTLMIGLPAIGQTLSAQSVSFSRDSTTGALDV